MPARHSFVPRLWLMTDERMGDALWPALERLPRGSGVVFRHYRLPRADRAALYARVAKVARRRGLVLLRAGKDRLGPWESGTHGWSARDRSGRKQGRPGAHSGLHSVSVHNRVEALRAIREKAGLVFVSPIFATRSHPGARALGRIGFAQLIRGIKAPVIALGGMTERRARTLRPASIHGWAAIDAWIRP